MTSSRSRAPVIAQKRIRRHIPRPLVNWIERDDIAANERQLRRQRRPNGVGRAKVVVDERHLHACANGSATRAVGASDAQQTHAPRLAASESNSTVFWPTTSSSSEYVSRKIDELACDAANNRVNVARAFRFRMHAINVCVCV